MMIDPPPSRVRRCLIFGFTSHILKIRQQTTVLTQRIHMNTKLSTTISYSLNNLLHYVCVPVHKKTTTTKPHGFKENVKTFTLIIPEIGKIALFFNQNCLTRGVTALTRAVSGEKQIYSGNLEILPGIGKPGKFFRKYEIFSGH